MKLAFAIPGDLALPTGGYAYARRLLAEWPEQGVSAEVIPLPAGYPHPDAAELHETRERLRGIDAPLLIDGLAYGAFPDALAAETGPKSAILLHHPLCDERGLSADQARRMEDTERSALAHARAVIVTSPATARDLAGRFGVPDSRIIVAVPGTDPAPEVLLAGDPPRILAVGTVSARKGYDLLVAALARNRDMPWRCDIFGATDRDPGETDKIGALIADAGLGSRIALRGAADDAAIADAYRAADLFVAPSRHEGYGMAVVEAMAHGLPVIASRAGALAETAPCARLVPTDDAESLADAMRDLLIDADARRKLGAACRSYARTLPCWPETARIVADAMHSAFER